MSKLRTATLLAALAAVAHAAPAHATEGFTVSNLVTTTSSNLVSTGTQVVDAPASTTSTVLNVTTAFSSTITGTPGSCCDSVYNAYRTDTTTYANSAVDSYSVSTGFGGSSDVASWARYSGTITAASGTSFNLGAAFSATGNYSSTPLPIPGVDLANLPSLYYSFNGGAYTLFSGSQVTLANGSYASTSNASFTVGDTPFSFSVLAYVGAGSSIANLALDLNGTRALPTSTSSVTTLIDSYACAPVPEPDTYSLAGLAFGLVAMTRRRSRKAQPAALAI